MSEGEKRMESGARHGLIVLNRHVPEGWVDYNGHMGDFAYGIAFSDAVTAYMDRIGVDAPYRERTGATLYTLDCRIGFFRECHLGDPLEMELVLLAADDKRLHVFLRLRGADGRELALCEQLLMHVGRASGSPRAEPFPANIAAIVAQDRADHADLIRPDWLERRIGLSR